jgi:hypothetical protein
MIEFKPVGKYINQKEKAFLADQGLKWCGCCKTTKLIEGFSKGNRTCKPCQKIKTDKWVASNKDHKNTMRNIWRENNRNSEREHDRRRRQQNLEEARKKERLYYAQNREEIRARKLRDYHENKESLNERRKEKRNLQMQNPLFATAKRLRDRIRGVFKREGIPKNKTTQQLLGCDWQTAKDHLESRFVGGMSWDNMGKWHIDHIKPLSSATTEEELISLCHYSNLQPLWAFDNMSKGAKNI